MTKLMNTTVISLLFILGLCSLSFSADESITITTYYPSPYGSYDQLTTTRNTYLATTSGDVGIGTSSPIGLLHIYRSTDDRIMGGINNPNRGTMAFSEWKVGEDISASGNGSYISLYYLNSGFRATGNNLPNMGTLTAGRNATNGMMLQTVAAAPIKFIPGGVTEAMRITAAGSVGIGTASPNNKLEVIASDGWTGIYSQNTRSGSYGVYSNGQYIGVYASGGTFGIIGGGSNYGVYGYSWGSGYDFYGSGPKSYFAGSIGIGTAGPQAKLDVRGAIFANDGGAATPAYSFNADTNTGMYRFASDKLTLVANGQNTLTIDGTSGVGRVGIGTADPKYTLDVNGIIAIRAARTIISGLDGAGYHWFMVPGPGEPTDNALGFDARSRRVVTGPRWIKAFRIDHPLEPEKKYLIHTTLEGPEVGVYYRGEAELVNGEAMVKLPDYFEALTRRENRTVLLTSKFESNEGISMLAASEIKDGKFSVRAIDDKNPSQKFYWEVKAVRADVEILKVEEYKS